MEMLDPMCTGCGQTMKKTSVSLNASGDGYSLTVSGVPVYSCHNCGTSLSLADSTNTVRELVTTIIHALDTLAPIGYDNTMGSPRQCRHCRALLPKERDRSRAHFTASARLEPGREVIGVEYYGDALTCPDCGRRHPCVNSAVCHKISTEIQRAASYYV